MAAPFIQIIEFTTDDIDGVLALDRQWEAAAEGKRTVRRTVVTRDRNDPRRYMVLVFFDSYDSAMVNSSLPETTDVANQYADLIDGSMSVYDLDMVADRS